MDSSSSFISFFAVWLTHVINLSSQESSHGTAVFWLLVISKKKYRLGDLVEGGIITFSNIQYQNMATAWIVLIIDVYHCLGNLVW